MNTSAQAVNFNMDKFQASHFMDAAEDSVSILDPSFIAVRSTFSMLIGSLTENLIQWLSSRRVSFAQSLLKVTELQLSKSRRRFIVRTIPNMFGSELIIFHVNCSEACFFVIKFFYFLFLK